MSRPLLAMNPLCRLDNMGQYRLDTDDQCGHLCWYRRLCSSYSYISKQHSPLAPPSSVASPNCILHTDSVQMTSSSTCQAPAPTDQWRERAASSATIHNPCKDRPCDDASVCVPHYPHSSPSSPSFHCVPLPAQCGPPDQVNHGHVNVSGTLQGHTGNVSCHSHHVPSPRDLPLNITCQSVFPQGATAPFKALYPLPLKGAVFCVKGIYNGGFQITFNLQQGFNTRQIELHFMVRTTGVFWSTRLEKGEFFDHKSVGTTPLASMKAGDSFEMTIRLLSDHVQVTFNGDQFQVPLSRHRIDGVDVSLSKVFVLPGAMTITYVNLVNGC
ncbi:hypothetical protein ACOMHN_057086 [Nucella lapillus]